MKYLTSINYSFTYRNARACILGGPFWIMVFIFLFNACDNKEEIFPKPEITLIGNDGHIISDTTLLLGDSIRIQIQAKSRSDVALTHFNMSIEEDGVLSSIDSGFYSNEFDFTKTLVKGIAEQEHWRFYVRDRDSRKSEVIGFVLSKDTASQYESIITIDNIIFGAQNNDQENSFFSLETQLFYDLDSAFANQEEINLLCFYDLIEEDENTISSPGANIDESVFPGSSGLTNWTTRNTTRFKSVENVSFNDFEQSDNDSLILFNTFEFSAGNRKAKNLSENDIYAFVTEDGKRGLFRVNEVIGENEGSVKISIKIQAL